MVITAVAVSVIAVIKTKYETAFVWIRWDMQNKK